MKPFILTIGIPTLPERRDRCERLVEGLMDQIENAGAGALVQVILNQTERRTQGGPTIAQKRSKLIEAADAFGSLYHVQIDDDDSVTDDYIQEVLETIERTNGEAACISHYIEVVHPNGKKETAIISNRFDTWHHGLNPTTNEGFSYKQAPYFKVPILTKYCMEARPAPKLVWQEDYDFMKRLRPHLRGKTEAVIPKALYQYNAPFGNIDPEKRY